VARCIAFVCEIFHLMLSLWNDDLTHAPTPNT
jgi:hypothetical protein